MSDKVAHFVVEYKLVIWDWNGTILNDVDLCVETINQGLQKRNIPTVSKERYLDIFEFPVINYYQKLGFDLKNESFEKIGMEFIRDYQRRMIECRLHDCAREVFEALKAGAVRQTVLSALQIENLIRVLDHFELREFFPKVFGLDDHFAAGKIDLGRKLMQESGVPSKNVVLIGDTTHDFEVAQELGIDCVLFSGGHNSLERLKKCGVPIISSLKDIFDLRPC